MDPHKKAMIMCAVGIILSLCILASILYSYITAGVGAFSTLFYFGVFMIAFKKKHTAISVVPIFLYFLLAANILMFISFIAFGFLINDESVASFNADNHKHESKESLRLQFFISSPLCVIVFCYTIILIIFFKKDHKYLIETCYAAPIIDYNNLNDGPIIIPRSIVPRSFFEDQNEAAPVAPALNDWKHPNKFHIDVNVDKFVNTGQLSMIAAGKIKSMVF